MTYPKTARRNRYALLVVLLVASACTTGVTYPWDPAGTRTGASIPNTTALSVNSTHPATAPPGNSVHSTTPTTLPPLEPPSWDWVRGVDPILAGFSPTTTTTLAPFQPPSFESLQGIHTIRDFSGLTASGLSRWEQSVPGIEDIRIASTADDAEQPALWLAPNGEGDRPLLVILHSWSSTYVQHAGIPYAMWAQENGWAVIAPEFRGRNDDADAIGSELAVQDVVDAIDYATSQDGVDSDRVYAVGYSGGGMMSLLLAGRHPDKVTAVAAWGPPHDLIEFYRQSRAAGRHYARDLWTGCGGDPRESGPAQMECLRRSPMTYLDAAREQGVPVFIGQGIFDSLLSPSQGANAFNQLADPEDRLSAEEVEQMSRGIIPDGIPEPISTDTFFGDGDPEPDFARHSGSVWLVFFHANHDMVYQATVRWFASDPR